jgi:hypothetical protein
MAAAWPAARKAGQPIRIASPPEGLCTEISGKIGPASIVRDEGLRDDIEI